MITDCLIIASGSGDTFLLISFDQFYRLRKRSFLQQPSFFVIWILSLVQVCGFLKDLTSFQKVVYLQTIAPIEQDVKHNRFHDLER